MTTKLNAHERFIKYREEHLAIDPERLDEEWLAQPVLYDRAQQAILDGERSLNAAKRDLRDLKSRMWLEIKKSPHTHGLESTKSPTVGDIEQALLANPLYKSASQLVDDLTEVVEDAKAFVRSVEMKKTSLSRAVELWIGNYFATPKIRESKGGKHFTDFVYAKAEDKMRERLRDSAAKREERKNNIREKIDDPEVQEQFDTALEQEEKGLRQKKIEQLGLKDVPTTTKRTIKRKRIQRK